MKKIKEIPSRHVFTKFTLVFRTEQLQNTIYPKQNKEERTSFDYLHAHNSKNKDDDNKN